MKKTQAITIENNSYTVNFPSVGEIMRIESMKMALSNGYYGEYLKSNTKSAAFTLDLIDAISHFSVLIPSLKEDLVVKDLMNIDPFKAKALIKSYTKEFLPWYNELFKQLVEEEVEIKKEDEFNEGDEN